MAFHKLGNRPRHPGKPNAWLGGTLPKNIPAFPLQREAEVSETLDNLTLLTRFLG
jgi:hypothetical protein